jgi:hypothetical protein
MRAVTSGSVPPPPVTPTTRPLTQPVTETFASRDEVEDWIRAPSVPPPADSLDAAHSADTRRDASGARSSWRFIAPAAAVVAVALASTIAVRNAGNVAPDHPANRIAPPARTAAAVVAPIAPSSVLRAPEFSATRSVDAAVARAPVPHASNAASADDGAKSSATISVTSDLPARVTIDGAPQGTTPLRGLRRAPGRHVVGLVSIELDERLNATVEAKPGGALAVHAEFTRPVPVLRVR